MSAETSMTDRPTPEAEERVVLPPLDVDDDVLRRGVASVLFVADEPLSAGALSETLGVAVARVESALADLAGTLDGGHLGFELREVAGGWRLMTSPSARPVLERWLIGGRHGRLTQAALETLAVVAYRQPIARATIGEIRGVNPDGALRSLISRGLVTEVGREDGPGQAVLFGTTPQFLERMGLRELGELPPVPPYLPDGPAPDEPDVGGLAELRRRLRDGSERLGAAGAMSDSDDDAEAGMPPPRVRERPKEDGSIGALSERLEQAARSAMGRLRSIVPEPEDPDAVTDQGPAAEPASEHMGPRTGDDDA